MKGMQIKFGGLSLAPSIRLRRIFGSLLRGAGPINMDCASFGACTLLFSRSSVSLTFLAHMCSLKHENVCVMVPDFFCDSVLSELRELGFFIQYYSLDERLNPIACSEDINSFEFVIFVFVHYFGLPRQMPKWLSEFGSRKQFIVVSDAVHCRSIDKKNSLNADATLYSLHKHFATPSGALLIVDQRLLEKLDMTLEKVIKSADHFRGEIKSVTIYDVIWFFKRLIQRLGFFRLSIAKKNNGMQQKQKEGVRFRVQSLFARWLLENQYQPEKNDTALANEREFMVWAAIICGMEVDLSEGIDATYLLPMSHPDKAFVKTFFDSMSGYLPLIDWPDSPKKTEISIPCSSRLEKKDNYLYASLSSQNWRFRKKAIARHLLDFGTIGWSVKSIKIEEWLDYEASVFGGQLVQHPGYAESKKVANTTNFYYLILDQDGDPVAICSLRSVVYAGLLEVIRLNRGPILLGSSKNESCVIDDSNKIKSLFTLLNQLRSTRLKIWLIAPDVVRSQVASEFMSACGFHVSAVSGWTTGKLDLRKPLGELLSNCSGSWRNGLKKAQKANLYLKSEILSPDDHRFYELYRKFQESSGFTGVSTSLVRNLCRYSDWGLEVRKFSAYSSESSADYPLATIVAVKSGDVATYLIGVSGKEGRKCQATSLLLWRAIEEYKRCNIRIFDLGGIDFVKTKGIAKFKAGLGPKLITLIGEYIAIRF